MDSLEMKRNMVQDFRQWFAEFLLVELTLAEVDAFITDSGVAAVVLRYMSIKKRGFDSQSWSMIVEELYEWLDEDEVE